MKSCINDTDEVSSSNGCGCCIASHPRLDQYLGIISQESTIHGVKYIGSKTLHIMERLFWTIVMIVSTLFGIYLVLDVFDKYYKNPLIISFQPQQTSVSQIPFPAITICNVNMIRTNIVRSLYHETVILMQAYQYFGHKELFPQILQLCAHLDHLGQYCLQTQSFRRKLKQKLVDINGEDDYMQIINDFLLYNLTDNETKLMSQMERDPQWLKEEEEIFENATINCDDLLLKCMWAGDVTPCKEIFFPIVTRHGRCCVFNMMPKFLLLSYSLEDNRTIAEINRMPNQTIDEWKEYGHDDLVHKGDSEEEKEEKVRKYPKHQKTGGKTYGLTVLINPNLDEYSTCTTNDGYGFKMVAHSPLSNPSIIELGSAVPAKSEIFVDIDPQITFSDSKVLTGIPIKKRGCYMPTDPEAKLDHYNYYSQENCFSECVANYTYQNCSCIRFFMPGNESQDLCGAKSRACAEQVIANLTKGYGKDTACGHCLPSCTEIIYKLRMSHFDLRQDDVASYFTYSKEENHAKNATNYSILHIYMGTDSVYAKERKRIYDWLDLIANAGGLISLTLGISVISIIEIGYFFTFGAWFRYRPMSKTTNTKLKIIGGEYKKQRQRSSAIGKAKDGYYNWSTKNRFSISSITGTGKASNATVVPYQNSKILF